MEILLQQLKRKEEKEFASKCSFSLHLIPSNEIRFRLSVWEPHQNCCTVSKQLIWTIHLDRFSLLALLLLFPPRGEWLELDTDTWN